MQGLKKIHLLKGLISKIATPSNSQLQRSAVACQTRLYCAIPPSELLQDTKSSISGPDLTIPSSENAVVYPPHIEDIVQRIAKLTLLEVADLNALLKKTLNIADAPVMAYGSMPAAAPVEEEEEVAQAVTEQSTFTVKLTGFDASKKVPLIKEIKGLIEGMNLVQAKKFVEGVPTTVKADLTKDEAKELEEKLKAVGGEVRVE